MGWQPLKKAQRFAVIRYKLRVTAEWGHHGVVVLALARQVGGPRLEFRCQL